MSVDNFKFHGFLMPLATGRKEPSLMTKAAFWVSVAQLVVAILALAVAILALAVAILALCRK